MWMLDKPQFDAESTYLTCISRVRNRELKKRLESVKKDIIKASEEYDTAADNIYLHKIESSDTIRGQVSVDDMKRVYNQRMVSKKSPGREIYDEIILAPINGICPFCGHRYVSTLDHYLPKAHYPALTVAPLNLIPACFECNKLKSDNIPEQPENLVIHPYYDNIQESRWLYANVVETNPAVFNFFVKSPDEWDEIKSARVNYQFLLLKLNDLYSSQAAQELSNIRYYLNNLFETAGTEAVRSHLIDMAETRLYANANSWQTATYQACSQNEWFIEKGFK